MVAPTVSIIIPTYNREAMLQDVLTCMVNQETNDSFNYEVLVIDDASTDNTPEVIKIIAEQASVPVRYVREEGRGITRVLNRAIKEAHGQWLAFFDDDQMTHSCWLKQLFAIAMEQDVEMVGGPIMVDLPESVLNNIGSVCRDLYGESPDVIHPEMYLDTNPLPSGGNRLIHKRVFEVVGHHDESMLAGGADRDFLLRAVAAGIKMGWEPKAIGKHRILAERFAYKFIKGYSLQWGCAFAHIDKKRWGISKTVLSCVARIGQALLINLPKMLLAKYRKNNIETLDYQALLWRAVGYVRKTLQLVAPRCFAQESFFRKVEFRRAREK